MFIEIEEYLESTEDMYSTGRPDHHIDPNDMFATDSDHDTDPDHVVDPDYNSNPSSDHDIIDPNHECDLDSNVDDMIHPNRVSVHA